MEPGFQVGIDIGGTFTDGFALSESGDAVCAKVPTTPEDPALGALNCVDALAEALNLSSEQLLTASRKFAHAQTATVNAMVQRSGARTGFITTKGFGDTLTIMNVSRGIGLPGHELGDSLRGQKPEPLVPHRLTVEVDERVDLSGKVLRPLDRAEAANAVRLLLAEGVEAIAVSLLWAFSNAEHERLVWEVAHELAPELPVSLSSEIAPIMGEYERGFTTVANAYLAPALERYAGKLQSALSRRGLAHPVLLMQSNGGLIPASEAPQVAATTMLSGLAGGVMGAAVLAEALGLENVISADMGGTSFEVSLIANGKPVTSNYPLASRLGPYIWRWKLAIPNLDITAIGSGGGSIARVEEGILKVGPLSAGADPGPACYGRGGVEPTITDADLVLGYLNPDHFLGGRMPAYPKQAHEAIRTRVAEPLGLSVTDAAMGIVEVANSQMSDLLRSLTIRKGLDPRDFHLVAFGGAGPLHMGQFGPELGVRSMIVPGVGYAAAYSALGVAMSDYRLLSVHTDRLRAPFDPAVVEQHFVSLEQDALKKLTGWGVKPGDVRMLRSVEARYSRQFHVVEVPVGSSMRSRSDADALVSAFEAQYEAHYGKGTAVPEAGVEITNLRVLAIGSPMRPGLRRRSYVGADASGAVKGDRAIILSRDAPKASVPIYAGEMLVPGNIIEGPAIIEYVGTTVLVHPDQRAEIDAHQNCVVQRH